MTIKQPRDLNTILAEGNIVAEIPKTPDDYPYHIAFVIDNVVQQVFHVEEKLAAILLSNPDIIQCEAPANNGPDIYWIYNSVDNKFVPPVA